MPTTMSIALKLVLNRSLEHLVRETESEVRGGGKERGRGRREKERREGREWREGEG